MTEEEEKHYRQRKLEIHAEVARDRQLYADHHLALALKNAKVLKRRNG